MQTLVGKINKQIENNLVPTILFTDIDATVSAYTPNGYIANRKTTKILKKYNIPSIFVTGRTLWHWINEFELNFYGLGSPDAVITSNGATLLWRTPDGSLETDRNWHDEIEKSWNKEEVEKICNDFSFSFKVFRKKIYHSKPLFLYSVHKAPVSTLLTEIEKLKKLLPKNVRIDISESLLLKNTAKIFSGGIFVTPEICGKAGVVTYILSKIESKKIRGFIFGDACIDIPMLSLPSTNNRTFHQYLVNPTPLAEIQAKKIPSITIVKEKGPQAIHRIMNHELGIINKYIHPQNSPVRKVLRIFEPFLDKVVDKKLTPNEISFLGLRKALQGVNEIEAGNKLQGLKHYIFGNFTDILDGIRSRLTTYYLLHTTDLPGQLVDVYCDRAREFYQLYKRGDFQAAASCFLPSIARSQAEKEGIIVSENDQKGGSSFDRTRLLFQAFIYQAFGNSKKSIAIDGEILKRNIATYENRESKLAKKEMLNPPSTPSISQDYNSLRVKVQYDNRFIQDALERFLLLVQLLQEADALIENKIKLQQDKLQEYKKFQKEYLNNYLEININTIRQKNNFKKYDLLTLYKILQ